ncbi:MAG: malectin domain-containing carbohydrate-binding protein [bacterium]|nr:malectin domain-containing carbohydrate-binding protein [bacterium]
MLRLAPLLFLPLILAACSQRSPAPSPPPPVVAINLGGPACSLPDGTLFLADKPFDPLTGFGHVGGKLSTSALSAPASLPPIFTNARWGDFSLIIDLSNGLYDVSLFALESHWTQALQRLFHIRINGSIVDRNVDLFARATTNPIVLTYPVHVTKERLHLDFVRLIDEPLLNAILVRPRYAPLPLPPTQPLALFPAPWHWDARTNSPHVLGGIPTRRGRKGSLLLSLPLSNGLYRVTLTCTPPTQPRWLSLFLQDTPLPFSAWSSNSLICSCAVIDNRLELVWNDHLRRALLSHVSIEPLAHVLPATSPSPPPLPPMHALDDAAFLDQVARDAFQFFLEETDPRSGLTRDSSRASVASLAASGFYLSALAYAAERDWLPRAHAKRRALRTLTTLITHTNLQRHGLFVHYATLDARPVSVGETGVSTIDSALLFMGALTAAEYFGGSVAALAFSLLSNANWRAFQLPDPPHFVSMLWEPATPGDLNGPGRLIQAAWDHYTDEAILISLLAVAAPLPEHRLPPETFYTWHRPRADYPGVGSFIRSGPNTLFTYTFAHLWLDFRSFGRDRQGIDWFENARLACLANRQFCLDHAHQFLTFSSNRWGLSACADGEHYIVPSPTPNAFGTPVDVNGTVAPYAAGMALMFIPHLALPALREMASLVLNQVPLYSPRSAGGYGFWDSFNMDASPPRVTQTALAIDQGPLLMAIANYRHAFFWRLLRRNRLIQQGFSLCGFSR